MHAQIQKVLLEGGGGGGGATFIFFLYEGREDPNTAITWAIISLPAKCHLNGV